MGFSKLVYTKNWENPSDFPTVETNETKVRQDMQCLYDEVAVAFNLLVDELDAADVSNLLYPIKTLSAYNASKAWAVTIELGTLSENVTVTLPAMSSSKRDDLVITAYQPSGGSYTVTVAVDDSTTEGLVSDTESTTFTPGEGAILELSVSGIGEVSSKRYAAIASKEWEI